MTTEKYESEVQTLRKFYELYCKDKHVNQNSYDIDKLKINLCEECFDSINYSIKRLKNCPHEIKPRCRKCPTPCYEKQRWKNIAKVMKYSAIKLSIGKIKSRILKILD